MKSKTIILSTNEKFAHNSPRAIITFIEDNNKIDGKIRLYNLSNLDNGIKLGIYHNNKVISSSLQYKNDCYIFNLDDDINLSQDLYCALIDTKNNNKPVLSGGSAPSFDFSVDEYDEEIEETTNCTNCDCKNCTYKQYFYAHQDELNNQKNSTELDVTKSNNENLVEYSNNIEEATTTPIIQSNNNETSDENANLNTPIKEKEEQLEKETSETETFLNSINLQLDEMFNSYPIDEEITKIIPNSKIIKVTDSVDNASYVLGVIYENEQIAYLVYGVPSKYNQSAPSELGENYQWLPLDPDDPLSDGYYLIYQDATNGKIVPVTFE